MRKVLKHAETGVQLVLDSSEIFPEDPGNGTPAIVEYQGGTSTLNCALGTSAVHHHRDGDIDLPPDALEWLGSQAVDAEVEAMYEAGRDGEWGELDD